jgi:hypothetical protein
MAKSAQDNGLEDKIRDHAQLKVVASDTPGCGGSSFGGRDGCNFLNRDFEPGQPLSSPHW